MTAIQPVRFVGKNGWAELYHADCLDLLPINADFVLTDPPYGIGEARKNHKSRNRVIGGGLIVSPDYGCSEWDDSPADIDTLRRIIACAPHSIIWGGNYFGLPAAPKWLVWDKLNSGDFADCELAWTNLPGAVRKFAHMWNGMLRDSERGTPRVHPTQKPVALMSWCLEQSKLPIGTTVLDPYMGSGPTGIACLRTGRNFIGIEKDAAYFKTACERFDRETDGELL